MNSIIEDTKIQHCQTQVKQDRFCYTWNIVDFWNIYKFKIDLYSSKAKNDFRFRMTPIENDDNSTINFYGLIDNFEDNTKKICMYVNNYNCIVNKANKNVCYTILFKANETQIAKISSQHLYMEPKNHYLLYPLPVSSLPLSHASSNMTLTVYFEFFIFVEMFDNNIYYSHKRLATRATDISIYEEKPDSLVTFLIGQERLEANKYLLCSKSKVFKAMFNNLKGSNEIQITDIKYNTLKELLLFLKTGYLPRSLENVNASVNVYELFIAADKYGIQDLKLICQQHLIICTTVKNVLEHLKIAHLYNGKILAEYAKNFIKLYLKVLVGAESVTLMQMYPELLTEIKKKQINQ